MGHPATCTRSLDVLFTLLMPLSCVDARCRCPALARLAAFHLPTLPSGAIHVNIHENVSLSVLYSR